MNRHEAEDVLHSALRLLAPEASVERLDAVVEAVRELAEALADQALDREFNRGDYRR